MNRRVPGNRMSRVYIQKWEEEKEKRRQKGATARNSRTHPELTIEFPR